MGLEWLVKGTGSLTVGAGQVGGAACTDYALDGRPDVQILITSLIAVAPMSRAQWRAEGMDLQRVLSVRARSDHWHA